MGIMRGNISNEDVAIYYIEQDEKEKSSIVTKIEINEMGQYSELPDPELIDRFFTVYRLTETKEQTKLMVENILKRKR